MRRFIARVLKFQSKRYLIKNQPKVVVVVGSVGKTSTTQAIANIIEENFKTIRTIANYNTDIGVPCSIFKRSIPDHLYNPFAWIFIFIKNEISLLTKSKVEILVLELGTDKPGEIAEFSWLEPDLAVVTAISAEHMENFKNLDMVAEEELEVVQFSKKLLINKNMLDSKYLKLLKDRDVVKYGEKDLKKFKLKPKDLLVVGDHSINAVTAGLAVGVELGIDKKLLAKKAKLIKAISGRMNVLNGIKGSTLIDDTYNSSPADVFAALDYLHRTSSKQKIALLGNMNELGNISRTEHIKIGEYCDPKKLNLVVTLGIDANKYTATAARAQGCLVEEAQTPYEAADIINRNLKDKATVLLKGSQNGVFAEEATKLLLKDPADDTKLVRQSAFWLIKKQENFRETK